MSAIVLSCLISGAFGIIVGRYYSLIGWVITASLLLLVTTAAALAAGASLLAALGVGILMILAFNIGLAFSLVVRSSARFSQSSGTAPDRPLHESPTEDVSR